MTVDVLVRDVLRRGEAIPLDIAIADGRIVAAEPRLDVAAATTIDGGGSLVLPGFVCAHLHLDKTLIADHLHPRSWTGDRPQLRAVNREDRRTYTVESVLERAQRAVEMALAHGTTYIRGFTDVEQIAGLTGTHALVALRERYASEIRIDVAVHPQDLLFARDDNSRLFEEAVAAGADVVGGMPSEEPTPQLVRTHVDFCLGLGKRNGLPVHMFVDDSDDPSHRALEYLAWRTIQEGMEGRVTAGHCGALSAYDDAHAAAVVALVAEAGISICVNSHISLTLRGRQDRAPVRRGTTRVLELLAAGVNVIAAQDDIDDPYYPLGRGDPLEVAHYTAHVCQLLWPDQLETVFDMITGNAAQAVGLEGYGLQPGCRADLVLLGSPTLRAALAAMAPPRAVIAAGRLAVENAVTRIRHRV